MKNAALVLCLVLVTVQGAAAPDTRILPMRERAAVVDRWLDERHADRVAGPDASRRHRSLGDRLAGIQQGPGPRALACPRHGSRRAGEQILLIHDPGDGAPLETLAVARYGVGDTFVEAWDKEQHGDQWQRLAELIVERDPRRIGLNYSETFALADGISHTEHRLFREALPENLHERIVSAEQLAIGWLETRSAAEMEIYPQIVRIAHEILAGGLSDAVIQPGVTTTDDVAWWYRDRVRELKLASWFHPSVSVQRAEQAALDAKASIAARHDDEVIRPGDLLHVDFGITYLRLNTDTQQHAYVLRPGETAAPPALREAFARGNRLQDILTGHFETGISGNDILARALAQAEREGITASIYTHPIGYHGHAAGPTIGLWDQQGGVPGRGDYPLNPDTAHSIELYAETEIGSWGKAVRIKLEEDAFFDGETTWYIDGRQRELFLIPRSPAVQ
ncbi:MAG: M24 family metallopeptidase [Woeseiaceae bacterium]|nr:M24 family metallopeptidase [Woeseiaceae bacterium]